MGKDAVIRQAENFLALARAAAGYFREGKPEAVAACRRLRASSSMVFSRSSAGRTARPAFPRAARSVPALPAKGRLGKDVAARLGLSRCLTEAAEELAWAVQETQQFIGGPRPPMADAAAAIREAAAEILRAARFSPGAPRGGAPGESRREDGLVAAKKRALEVERICRKVRGWEPPNVIEDLKLGAIYRRFSNAAEAIQKAADLIAETLIDPPRC